MVYRTTPKMIQRKQARREKLLDTAIRLFGRQGYHATTVPAIVARAGSSIGSFYLYFRNKEDIFEAVLETLGERIAAALNEAIRAAGPDVLAQMKAAIRGLVQFLVEHPREARILIVESSGLSKRLETARRRVIASHTRSVELALGALADRLPPMEISVVANCWFGAVYEGIFQWLVQPPRKRLPAERLANAVACFNLRGIGAPAHMLE